MPILRPILCGMICMFLHVYIDANREPFKNFQDIAGPQSEALASGSSKTSGKEPFIAHLSDLWYPRERFSLKTVINNLDI